jgi:hypothetical protein
MERVKPTLAAEAADLAAAAGLRLGEPVAVSRDVGPVGWYEDDSAASGPGAGAARS